MKKQEILDIVNGIAENVPLQTEVEAWVEALNNGYLTDNDFNYKTFELLTNNQLINKINNRYEINLENVNKYSTN